MEAGGQANVRVGSLFPGITHHLDSAEGSVLSELLVGLVGIDNVVGGKDDAHQVPQPLWLDVHGGRKTGIEGSDDPGGAVKVTRVHASERLGSAKAEERVEVTDSVNADGAEHDDLPWRKAFKLGIDLAYERTRTIATAGGEKTEPKEDDRKDLNSLELGRGSTEEVIDHDRLRCAC